MKVYSLLITAIAVFAIPGITVSQNVIYSKNKSDLILKLPEFQITNSNITFLKPDDFVSKNIIIDFWATWCMPCIANLPKMQKFQDEFRNSLKVILVTTENKVKVDEFFSTRMKVKKDTIALPSIYEDKELYRHFPHTSIPHYVWIDTHGEVKAITSDESLTRENLQKFVDGKPFQFIAKSDSYRIDRSVPFYNEKMSIALQVDSGRFGPEQIKYRSVLTKAVKGFTANGGNFTGRLIGRGWLAYMFKQAYEYSFGNKLAPVSNSRVIFEIKNRNKYLLSDSANYAERVKWNEENTYLYDLIFPDYYKGLYVDLPKENLRKLSCEIMKRDLEKFTGLKSQIQERNVECLVLKSIDSQLHLSPEKFEAVGFLPGKTGFVAQTVENMMTAFSYFLQLEKTPIIDGTYLNTPINIRIQSEDMLNVDLINNELHRFGFSLVKEDRIIPMLVISDK